MSNDLWILVPIFVALALSIFMPAIEQIRRIEAKLDRLLALQGIDDNKWREPSAEAIELAKTGENINALKLYRKQTGASLKEAKERIKPYADLYLNSLKNN
jgi:ribosomal protein L7/L12